MAPFTYAYAPYNIAIAIATAGVPLAASKYVAKYNALGAYKVSQKFYKSSFSSEYYRNCRFPSFIFISTIHS